ncbi:MAG: site-2 protease family protein [Gemmatimonadaceae bacterium]|nr:site-2 protease family protein [Gemmatimonadaceae bacterium]MCW5826266.1 site-2 protease family protein [Gemmatimonadaceae bacterium]
MAGIPLRVHITFPMLLAWIALVRWRADGHVVGAASLVVLVLTVFAIVVLHELGHALVARRYGIRTRDITLLPIGGLARLERIPREPRQELLIALAGPAVNVVLAAALALVLAVSGTLGSVADALALLTTDLSLDWHSFAMRLLAINVWLVAFNMLPAFPMDGGRVLRALLTMYTRDHAKATVAAAALGRGFAVLFGFAGLFVLNSPVLVLIAVFVWLAGAGEAATAQAHAAFEGQSLEAMLITELRTLRRDEPLSRAAQLLIDGFQADFPVLDGDVLVGMLSRSDLVRGLSTHGPDGRVEQAMRRDGPALDASTAPEDALLRLASSRATAIPVLRQGRLIGLLTTENVMEFLMLRRISSGRPAP